MNVERLLDRALAGNASDDPEVGSLVTVARELDRAFAVDPERWSRERAFFVAGVAAQRRGVRVGRFLVPALATLLVVAVAFAGRFALPGDALYPVRQMLQNVGLASSVWAIADEDIAQAARLVAAAEAALVAEDLVTAEEDASAAIARLDHALEELEDLGGDGKVQRVLEITGLQDRAEEVIAAVEGTEDVPDPSDRGPEPGTVGTGRKGDDEDDEGDDDDDDETDTDDRDTDTGNATDGDEGPDDPTVDGAGETLDGDGGGDGGGDDGETLDGNGSADPEELDD